MIGLELVRGDGRTPADVYAEAVQAACLRKGVLVGVGGVYCNVVRLQPPLVISNEQIDVALATLKEAIAEVTSDQHP